MDVFISVVTIGDLKQLLVEHRTGFFINEVQLLTRSYLGLTCTGGGRRKMSIFTNKMIAKQQKASSPERRIYAQHKTRHLLIYECLEKAKGVQFFSF